MAEAKADSTGKSALRLTIGHMIDIGQNGKAHRHLVVGDGITAAAFIEGSQLEPDDELIVIGKRASKLGRGIAYADETQTDPWCHAYLLNSPAEDIDPDFAKWLEHKWEELQVRMQGRTPDWLGAAKSFLEDSEIAGLNAPRAFYGEFMEARIAETLSAFRQKGIGVQLMDACVVAIEDIGSCIRIETDAKQIFEVHSVDIAPGGPSNQRFPGDDGPFSTPSLFGNEARIAQHVEAGAEIFCVGANATMLDALRLCQALIPEEQIKFVACSPRGSLPPPLVPRFPTRLTTPQLRTGHKSTQSFLDEVWTSMENARAKGDEMREIRAGFRAYFLEHGLRRFILNDNEARQVPKTLQHWLRGGTRDTIHDFHRLMTMGKCRTLGGGVTEIETTSEGARVVTRDKANNVTAYETGFVINCAGAGPGSTFDPLTTHMLKNGWINICSITGGLEVGELCQTGLRNVRYLSPATTVIGNEVMPMPLYDAHILRTWAKRACLAVNKRTFHEN